MSTRKTTVFYAVLIAIASVAVGMVIASQWGLPQASSAQPINVPTSNTAALNGPIDAHRQGAESDRREHPHDGPCPRA
jgi:hypothetical protein